jgi:uncharacterized caspase-like protein
MILLAGCKPDQEGYEPAVRKETDTAERHGAFTQALLEGVQSKDGVRAKATDDDNDKVVSANGLARYVNWRVPKRVQELDPRARQDPISHPPLLPREPRVPLFAVP